MRPIDQIRIWLMHREGGELDDAIAFVEGFDDEGRGKPAGRYEIEGHEIIVLNVGRRSR